VTQIEIYANWQPGYMGERIPTKQYHFDTLDEARETIDKLRKTACTIIVSEFTVLEEYTWGKKKKKHRRVGE
jgi:hypothetical protein